MGKKTWASVVTVALLGLIWLVSHSELLDHGVTAASGSAAAQLQQLTVATPASMTGYSRDRFPHWSPQPKAGKNCNTREAVLVRDGKNVKTDSRCQTTSGTWTSVYTGETVTDQSKIDIDHLVPLANAWRSGANKWTDADREKFANDMTLPQLVAVDSSSNRSKGDQDPSQWKPSVKTQWCEYATDWVQVKSSYKLTVTDAEKKALSDMLGTCK